MPTNNFLPFATGVGSSANLSTQSAYASSSERSVGFVSGLCPRIYYNKALRQSAFIAAAIGQWLVSKGYDALDDGDLTTMTNNMIAAWTIPAATFTPTSTDTLQNKTISGSQNTISNLNASVITSGTLPIGRGGTGLGAVIGGGKVFASNGTNYLARDPANINVAVNLTGGSSGSPTPIFVGYNQAKNANSTNEYILPDPSDPGDIIILSNKVSPAPGGIILQAPSGETIQGSSSITIADSGSAMLIKSDATTWDLIPGSGGWYA